MALKLFILLLMALATSAAETTNVTVLIAGKQRTIADVETMIRNHAKKTNVPFKFEGAKRDVNILKNSGGVFMTFRHTNETGSLMGMVDKDGRTWAQFSFICGGDR